MLRIPPTPATATSVLNTVSRSTTSDGVDVASGMLPKVM
jgi:hypothetical protein